MAHMYKFICVTVKINTKKKKLVKKVKYLKVKQNFKNKYMNNKTGYKLSVAFIV